MAQSFTMQVGTRVIFLPLCFFICLVADGQRKVNLDSVSADWSALRGFYSVGGQPVGAVKFSRLTEGSPFYNKNWHKADLELKEGGKIKDITMRLNLLDNQVHFMADDLEMVAIKPVKEVKIPAVLDASFEVFRSGYPATANTNENTFFEVLVDGKATLLKHIKKQMFENKPYGSATTEQQIREQLNFYIYKNDAVHRIKSKAEIVAVLADQKASISELLAKENLNLKKEEDLKILITYYNNLAP